MNTRVEGSGGTLIGVVLSGGESRRMGRDKGLMIRDGLPWAVFMGQKLRSRMRVFYSINPGQQAAYSAILPAETLISDALDLPGPINGLLSVHQRLQGPDILLVSCDMLDLDRDTISSLIAAWGAREENRPEADFFAYGDTRLWQPFCCIYTSRGLRKAAGHASLQSLLRAGPTRGFPLTNPAAFANYNSL